MARAAAPIFSPSCGSTRIDHGPGGSAQSLVLSVPAPGIGTHFAAKRVSRTRSPGRRCSLDGSPLTTYAAALCALRWTGARRAIERAAGDLCLAALRPQLRKGYLSMAKIKVEESGRRDGRRRDDPHHLAAHQGQADPSLSRHRPALLRPRRSRSATRPTTRSPSTPPTRPRRSASPSNAPPSRRTKAA